jgi:hypothetical protein
MRPDANALYEEDSMVDREARLRAHDALQRFVTGQTTNDEFEREYPDSSVTADRAIRAVETMVWNFYQDHTVHRLVGDHAPDVDGSNLLHRCLAFLQSDQEYAWPIDNFIGIREVGPVLNALTLGTLNRRLGERYRTTLGRLAEAGDLSSWPFSSGTSAA